ncbi:nitrate reductase molybdenum cofactor assembly chaperone [Martelella alba]|uniref:Nitrate reductase molybdenum cofactor assembly chaperone n=1 Tax=Martelella alba TaxID=2590451 RepID=A0ABY2SLS4_9HYPH|nr:nitrate reductase molybdenum cofactor assembly chaperone [Martelella alba]TKI06574.1 nitrate reductase molybdenum cofactor assembly chaperone [Martelella alba]
MISLKIISFLLDYPDQALWDCRDELAQAAMEDPQLRPVQRTRLTAFIGKFCFGALLDAQETYCGLFDRGRATSLLLFEHVHGESRDRGRAMVDLLAQYQAAGLESISRELPDYLPVYLEYLATRAMAQALDGLRDIAPILALLGARLRERESLYAELFDLLLSLCDSQLRSATLREYIGGEARDDTPGALDAVWEEEQVTFLAGQGCEAAELTRHQRRFAGSPLPQYLAIGPLMDADSPVSGSKGH